MKIESLPLKGFISISDKMDELKKFTDISRWNYEI